MKRYLQIIVTAFVVIFVTEDTWATFYFSIPSGDDAALCADIDSTDITVRPTSYGTISRAAECATVAGDVVVVRGGLGTYTGTAHQVNLQTLAATALASGTNASNMTQIIGDPADPMPEINVDGWYLSFTPAAQSIRHWIRISGLNIAGNGGPNNVVMFAGTNLLVENSIIHNSQASCIFLRGDAGDALHTVRNNELYDCGTDGNGYGVYAGADDAVIERNNIHHSYGQGGQFVWSPKPGGPQRGILRNNYFHDIIKGTISTINGCLGWAVSGPNAEIYDNIFDMTSCSGEPSLSTGISLLGANGSNAKIHNNLLKGTTDEVIYIGPFGTSTGATIHNNVFDLTAGVAIRVSNSSTYTATYNACKTADNCATSNKIVFAAATECVSNSTGLLVTGTNPCRDAGTSVSTRPSPIGVTDIGPGEQGAVASATVASTYIEATVNVMTPLRPTTGITGATITCVGCTGSPVVTAANVKAGSINIIQLTIAGLSTSGTCRLNIGVTNATDSGFVGQTSGVSIGDAQGINTITALDVSGTCVNTSGGAPPAGLWSEFLLDEGSGTIAGDSSGAGHPGTVSSGLTWVNNASGTGVIITTDATYRHVESTYGAAINPTATSYSTCALVLPDIQHSAKIVGSSGGNGTNQRAYYGWTTVNGVKQWGIGVQSSGFSSGPTEFPLEDKLTLVCVRFNAATDIANLSVDRTIGTSAAANKAYTSFTLVGNLRVGNDGTFTANNGGHTVYGMWVWDNKYLSDAEVQSFYDTLFASGGPVAGYAQITHRWQRVYLDGAGSPINLLSIGTQEIEVQAGGAVAVEMQVDCTGGDCNPLAVRLHATDLALNTGPVPQNFDVRGIAVWGSSPSTILNSGVSVCCLAGALTPVNGVTILDAVASNTVQLNNNSSTMFRFIVKVASDQINEVYTLSLVQDNGAPLDGVAGTTPKIRVVAPFASGGF